MDIINNKIIKSYLPDIPDLPGVYKMQDIDKNIIYIGKAKNLKNRISQYTLEQEGKNKLMVSLIDSLSYIVTNSESEALILESQLIKKFKPRFNILLKDDKSFPYIKLRLDHEYPQLLKYRGKKLEDGKFFGPFASVGYLESTLIELQKIFKLRSCSDNYFTNRTRPCLQYQIKRCSAPCVGKITKSDYNKTVSQVNNFLSGKNQILQKQLSEQMHDLSNKMEYEKAAEIRDKIKALSYIQMKSNNDAHLKDADLIAVIFDKGEFCIELFIYRSYQACGNSTYFFDNVGCADNIVEVLGNFIIQLYQNKKPPSEILINIELDDANLYVEALEKIHNINVKIYKPKKSYQIEIINNVERNAHLSLQKKLANLTKNIESLKAIKEIFNLAEIPSRIEVYDNSHIQGSFPVGAMVVAGNNGFEKKEYRLFNIKDVDLSKAGGDDYKMLEEVLIRRLKKIKLYPLKKPDFMIIDGGKGHKTIVEKVMNKLNVKIPFVCMSKGVDRNSGREFFHYEDKEAFTLDKNLAVMKYLQILRDEVHNFVIKSHRKKRSAVISKSVIEQIPGIGQARKKNLLTYFGSVEEIKNATLKELKQVDGVSPSLAKKIYEFFNC